MSLFSTIVGASSGVQGARVLPEGVDFDGAYDYLSRSSDFVGNTDGKAFTFSAWVYCDNANYYYIYTNISGYVYATINPNGDFVFLGKNSAGTEIFKVQTSTFRIPKNTFTNILLSVDLTNSANRYLYINDILQTPTWGTYINDTIDFTRTTHRIGDVTNNYNFKGRLSHVFLSHQYIDLSVEANRRIFVVDE